MSVSLCQHQLLLHTPFSSVGQFEVPVWKVEGVGYLGNLIDNVRFLPFSTVMCVYITTLEWYLLRVDVYDIRSLHFIAVLSGKSSITGLFDDVIIQLCARFFLCVALLCAVKESNSVHHSPQFSVFVRLWHCCSLFWSVQHEMMLNIKWWLRYAVNCGIKNIVTYVPLQN